MKRITSIALCAACLTTSTFRLPAALTQDVGSEPPAPAAPNTPAAPSEDLAPPAPPEPILPPPSANEPWARAQGDIKRQQEQIQRSVEQATRQAQRATDMALRNYNFAFNLAPEHERGTLVIRYSDTGEKDIEAA